VRGADLQTAQPGSSAGVYGEEVSGRYVGNPVVRETCAFYFVEVAVKGDISRSFVAFSTTSRAA
jgi:hypothetical protein